MTEHQLSILHILKVMNTKFDEGYDWFCWQICIHVITPFMDKWEKA